MNWIKLKIGAFILNCLTAADVDLKKLIKAHRHTRELVDNLEETVFDSWLNAIERSVSFEGRLPPKRTLKQS